MYPFSMSYYCQFDDVREKSYYNPLEKKIVIYFFEIKYGIETINSLDTTLFVEPYENFKGLYTKHFIYGNNKYQVISKDPEIRLNEFVEIFDYEKLVLLGISQYKLIGPYSEEDRILEREANERGSFSFYVNYIFPEELNSLYIKYSLF